MERFTRVRYDGYTWTVLDYLPVDVGWVKIWRETGRSAPNVRHGVERWVESTRVQMIP